MASPREQLRGEAVRLCARLRLVAEKACASDALDIRDLAILRAVYEGFGEELAPYEELFEDEPAPTAGACAAASREQLHASVGNYDLRGTADLADLILGIESGDTATSSPQQKSEAASLSAQTLGAGTQAPSYHGI